jgi:cytochrome c-type biogenesis protein CcmH/NrfF
MIKSLIWIAVAAALFVAAPLNLLQRASGQEASGRERALQDKFVAACCWNESIAHHRSPTAMEQRLELSRMIQAGRSDREIIDAFKAKYGARVLMEPEGNLSLTAYTFPATAAVLGLIIVIFILRRWARAAAKAA